ncbi:Fanconi anemia group I [Nymphon striatum]|nr:Fanconi anemia group I [Nymphon striatum]
MGDIIVKPFGSKKRRSPDIDIGKTSNSLNPHVLKYLLVIQAFSGCDATSAIFDQGKTSIITLVEKSKKARNFCDILMSSDSTVKEVSDPGIGLLVLMYSGRENDTLSHLRFVNYMRMTATSKKQLHPEKLPPTKRAAWFHSLRVYHQICHWRSLKDEKDPLEWSWKIEDGKMSPIMTDQLLDLLKHATLKYFKEIDICDTSKWIREMVSKQPDTHEMVITTVENSKVGWDYVVQGMVHFGFLLMDSCGPKGSFGRVTESSVAQHHNTPISKACLLGADILASTFMAHDSVRMEILEQLLNRIVIHASSPITQYVDLLSRTVHAAPQLLFESISKIREVLDYLSFLPSVSARQLLVALLPLLKISMPLKDSLMLVLRKALFSKQLESRKVAVNGFLLFLKHFKVLGSLPNIGSQASQSSSCSMSFLTQIQADVHSKTSFDSQVNEAFCLELLGVLRRCLQQQAEVRQILYTGLHEVIKRNTMLTSGVLSILCEQLKKYFESDENVQPPLCLDKCIGFQSESSELREPIAHLIAMLQMSIRTCKEHSNEDDMMEDEPEELVQAEAILTSLCRRIVEAELEDFELDKSTEFTSSSSIGQKNLKKAQLLLGIYDTLMEYSFMEGNFSVDSCQTTLDLFSNRTKLMKILEEKTVFSTGKKKDVNDTTMPPPSNKKSGSNKKSSSSKSNIKPQFLFSFNFLATMTRALFNDNFPNHQESLNLLRNSEDFMSYIITAASFKLQQLKEVRSTDSNYDKLFQMLCIMGRALVIYYETESKSAEEDINKKFLSQCLDVFSKILQIVNSRFKEKFMHFLASIEKKVDLDSTVLDDINDQEKVTSVLKKFQGLVNHIIADESSAQIKDIPNLINSIVIFESHLNSDSAEQLHNWIKELCKDNEIEDTAALKALLNLFFSVCRRSSTIAPVIRDICCDMHSKLSDIIEDVQVELCNYYKIVSASTITQLVSIVLLKVEQLLSDCEWMVTKIKAELTTCSSSAGEKMRNEQEIGICIQLGTLTTGLNELVQTALPYGPCFDFVFKCLIQFYNCMTSFIKYNISKVSSKNNGFCAKLEKLIKLSGMNLTPMVYAMINYLEGPQITPRRGKQKKKSDCAAEKAKVLKETKGIPALIFSIEQNERYLIQLSKKSKASMIELNSDFLIYHSNNDWIVSNWWGECCGLYFVSCVNLMAHVKLSTARDFRINRATVASALDDNSSSVSRDTDPSSNSTNVTQDEEGTDNPPIEEVDENQPSTSNVHSSSLNRSKLNRSKLSTITTKKAKSASSKQELLHPDNNNKKKAKPNPLLTKHKSSKKQDVSNDKSNFSFVHANKSHQKNNEEKSPSSSRQHKSSSFDNSNADSSNGEIEAKKLKLSTSKSSEDLSFGSQKLRLSTSNSSGNSSFGAKRNRISSSNPGKNPSKVKKITESNSSDNLSSEESQKLKVKKRTLGMRR